MGLAVVCLSCDRPVTGKSTMEKEGEEKSSSTLSLVMSVPPPIPAKKIPAKKRRGRSKGSKNKVTKTKIDSPMKKKKSTKKTKPKTPKKITEEVVGNDVVVDNRDSNDEVATTVATPEETGNKRKESGQKVATSNKKSKYLINDKCDYSDDEDEHDSNNEEEEKNEEDAVNENKKEEYEDPPDKYVDFMDTSREQKINITAKDNRYHRKLSEFTSFKDSKKPLYHPF